MQRVPKTYRVVQGRKYIAHFSMPQSGWKAKAEKEIERERGAKPDGAMRRGQWDARTQLALMDRRQSATFRALRKIFTMSNATVR